MTDQEMLGRLEDQSAGGILNPLVLVRTAEFKHRKNGGKRPECIKLSPDFYDTFMKAYKVFIAMASEEDKETLSVERPHVLGIPIVCEPGARWDIEVYVAPGRDGHELAPLIVVP